MIVMAIDFREGYEFFQKNAGALFGADIATEFGTSTVKIGRASCRERV